MNYFSEEIILFDKDVNDKEEALKLLSDQLKDKKLVENDFFESIIEREKNYPTGLQIEDIGIAIPHTDSDKVKKAQLGYLSLKQPVIFNDMGDADSEIKVSMIFMLALKDPHSQLTMLQKLIGLFQDKNLIERLKNCTEIEEFKKIIDKAGI